MSGSVRGREDSDHGLDIEAPATERDGNSSATLPPVYSVLYSTFVSLNERPFPTQNEPEGGILKHWRRGVVAWVHDDQLLLGEAAVRGWPASILRAPTSFRILLSIT